MMKHETYDPSITLPHIEKPTVDTGILQSGTVFDQYASGFTVPVESPEICDYEYCRHHWVGNGYGPFTPTCFADFSAEVSGANRMEVREADGKVIAVQSIKFSENPEKTPLKRITREGKPYHFDTLTFAAINNSGIESTVVWPEKKRSARSVNQSTLSTKIQRSSGTDTWEYPLMRLTWCMTSRCNLHCRHCAFRDMHKHMAELNGSEIQRVVQDIIQMGIPDVCLSGGEILLSPHWYDAAKTLSQAGVQVSLITNGTLIDRGCAEKIKDAGIACVSVSIDDLPGQTDSIRGENICEQALLGIQFLKAAKIPVSIITTVHACNIGRLDEMRSAFSESGADTWYLKPILPVGEAERDPSLLLNEKDICTVTDFCYSAVQTPGLPVIPALTFEMHTEKGAAVLRYYFGGNIHTDFRGSDAGIFSAQMHPDGSLVGTCMCSPSQAAGNVRERSLADIWQDKRNFKALREFNPAMLSGYCNVCSRRNTCKGGDLNVRLAFGGIHAENKFCAYRNYKLYGISI